MSRNLAFRLFVALASFLPIGLGEQPGADEAAVTVEGFAAIEGKSTAVARNLAIDDALRSAVRQMVGVLLSSETLTRNYELVEDRIATSALGIAYLRDVIDEGVTEDGLYRVLARVSVQEASLRQELHAAIRDNGDPRILIGSRTAELVLETTGIPALAKLLVEQGYSVTVSDSLPPSSAWSDQALRSGADVIVNVDFSYQENPNPARNVRQANLVSINSTTTLEAVDPATGRVIAVETRSAPGASTSSTRAAADALEDALSQLGPSLSAQLQTWMLSSSRSGQEFRVRATNVEAYAQLETFISRLEVGGATQVSLRDFRDGEAVIDLTYSGRLQGLLSLISGSGGQIQGVSGSQVEVVMR